MTRSIPPALADVVEMLELEQPVTVTTRELTELVTRLEIDTPANVVIQRLAERGWLLKTGVHGVWEFAPGEHAGPYSHNDRWLTLRAELAKEPTLAAHVALGSALWLLDLTDRAPDLPELAMPSGAHVPVALRRVYRVVRFEPNLQPDDIRGLPVHRPATVLVHLAHRSSDVRSWASVLGVFADLVAASPIDEVKAELDGRPHATRVRLAYLTQGIAPDLAESLGVSPGHKVWFGPRGKLRRHDATWNVADTLLPIGPADLNEAR